MENFYIILKKVELFFLFYWYCRSRAYPYNLQIYRNKFFNDIDLRSFEQI